MDDRNVYRRKTDLELEEVQTILRELLAGYEARDVRVDTLKDLDCTIQELERQLAETVGFLGMLITLEGVTYYLQAQGHLGKPRLIIKIPLTGDRYTTNLDDAGSDAR